MKKFMALCLTIIMVFSMFTVAVSAATITVPASTLVDQSFAGLSAVPSGWTITRGNEGTTYSFEEDGIQVLNDTTQSGLTMRKDEAFDAGNAPYTFSVTLNNYTGVNVVHFGADTLAQATQTASDVDWLAGVADTGYTFIARTGFNATGGTDYQYGGYYLYTSDENGEPKQLMQIADKNSSWLSGKSARKFEFIVTDTGITGNIWKSDGSVIESTASYTFAEGEVADKSGYIGLNFVNNNATATSSVSRLKQISVVANEYTYDVNTSGAATGGYIEIDGVGAFAQSFAGLSTAPEGWTITGSNYEYLADSIHAITGNGEAFMLKNDKFNTNGADYTFSVNIAASNKVSYVHFGANNTADAIKAGASATGYTLSLAPTSNYQAGKYTLYKNGTQIGQYELYSNWGYQNLKTITINVTSSAISISSSSGVVDTIADTAPITSGYIGVALRNNNVNWGAKLGQISLDYNATKSNFLLNKSFANADAEELAAFGFTVSGTGVNANGIYKTDGQASVGFATKFGGSYTIETYCEGNYNNPETITFNKTDDGDSYVLRTEGNSYSLTRNVDGEATTLVSETFADKAQCPYYTYARKHKIVITANEGGTKDIDVYLGTKQIVDITDEEPITAAGTVSVLTGWNATSNIHNLKVYPGATVPVITGNFLVNGTSSAVKGDTVFTFPVMMLAQDAEVIAALYEDGKMTDIKMVDFDTLNSEGYAQLFNTTASKANNANVKVFIWDSLAGMVPVTEAFALND